MSRSILIALLALAHVLIQPIFAKAASENIETIVISGELYARGIAESDPLMVALAAKLRLGMSPPVTTTSTEPAGQSWLSAAVMFKMAHTLAGRDRAAQTLIKRYEQQVARGSVDGPASQLTQVEFGSPVRLTRRFEGGRSSIVYVESPSPAPLAIRIYDTSNNRTPICNKTLLQGRAICRWIPDTTQSVLIELNNSSKVAADVLIVTN
jgi:hypothetical protein